MRRSDAAMGLRYGTAERYMRLECPGWPFDDGGEQTSGGAVRLRTGEVPGFRNAGKGGVVVE